MSQPKRNQDSLLRNPFTLVTSAIAIVIVVILTWHQSHASDTADGATPGDGIVTSALLPSTDPVSGFQLAPVDALPPEAATTINLIDAGGPFPHDQDGVVFENREGLLPSQPTGYYHEYTVETPGSADRGARRIIVGSEGEFYYTGDHYESFVRIAR